MYCWTCNLMCNLSKYALHSFLLFLPLLVNQPLWNLTKQSHADFSAEKSFLTPTIVWLNSDVPDLLITGVVHDKLNFLSLVYDEKLRKHCKVFENYFVGSKDKVGKRLKTRAVGWPTQVDVFNGDYERMGIKVILKAQFYLQHLLRSLADTWCKGDESSSSLYHIVNFQTNWFPLSLCQIL